MTPVRSPISLLCGVAVAACSLLAAFASAAPPVAGPNVNMVSGTRFPEGDPFVTKQNEPSIAVSSRNPRHLLAASNDYRQVAVLTAEGLKGGKAWNTLYKSVDGGTSWRSVVLGGCPLDIPACNDPTGLTAPLKALAPDFSADPTVRSGPHGTFFYSFIAGRRDGSADGVVAVQRFVDKNNNVQRDTDIRKIGGQDVIKWAEDPILPDKLNILDRGTSGQFIDKPWNAADVGGRSWNSGKTCDLLSWTNSSGIVTPAAETVPAFNVYVSYALFAGAGNNEHPSVYVAASQDCGNTFAKPVKVSNSLDATSGTSLFVNPLTGTVYVVWRRFGSLESPQKPDEIYMNKSADGGKTWLNQPVRVAQFIPYDQAATGGSFRTLAFPSGSVSIDSTGVARVHVAFTARGAQVNPLPPYACQSTNPRDCDARVKIATSTDGGLSWLPPVDVDPIPSAPTNPSGRGHQVQPALTFAAGKLFITWLDQRFDQTEEVLTCQDGVVCTANNLVRTRVPMGNLDPDCKVDVGSPPLSDLSSELKGLLGPDPGACYEYRPGRPASVWTTYLTDGSPGLVRRHTIDVFAAMALPADAPVFSANSGPVSQYQFGSTAANSEGKFAIRQKEVFAPNLPLFVNGGAAFVGDYIDAAGQLIVATTDGDPALPGKYRYKFNAGSATSPFTTGGLSPVFHVAHTDNRNVIPPGDGNWATPTCLATAFTGNPSSPTTSFGGCATPGFAGNRNQDVFSTIVAESSVGYANANAKALGTKPRAFVVTVDNLGADPAGRQYRFSIDAPAGVTASFDKDSFATTTPTPNLPSVDVQVQPRSSATRSVWVQAGASNAPVVVNITSPVGCAGAACEYSTQVALNPDPGATASLVGSGDGTGIDDVANNDLGNVVLSNAVLTNNVLSNNALTNAALSNNALTNAALSNVVLSNAVLTNLQVENLNPATTPLDAAALSNAVLTNAMLSNVVLTNAVLTNNVLTNNALSNAVLTNNALTNVALTNIDPANVALSNAALTNNVLTNVALSNNALTNVMLSNAALTNAALTNVVLSNAALSNNALSNNALSNNVLSNNALSNAALPDALSTVEAANPDLNQNAFTENDLAVSDFLDASFTVRNRGNTDTTLAVKLLLRDANCTGGSCSLPPGVKLQLVMRKIALTPTAIPPTAPAVDTGRALRLGLVQSNAQVSNVGTPEIVDPEAVNLGKFLPSKPDAATLPLSPGERAYVTLRAIGATADFNLVEFLRWGVKTVVVDAANDTRTLIPLIIKTLTLPSVTATQPASLPIKTAGGFGSVNGTAVCADRFGTPSDQAGFEAGTPCLPAITATFANDGTGNGTLAFTPTIAGDFYILLTVQDSSIPQQDDRQLLKVKVLFASAQLSPLSANPNFPASIAVGVPFDLGTLLGPTPLLNSLSPEPITFATDPAAASVCTVTGNMLTPIGVGTCTFLVLQAGTATYAAINVVSPPVTIVQGTQTIVVSAPAAKTYGDPNFTVSATGGGSGNPVTFVSTSPGVCTVSGTTVHIVAAGSCSLTADQAGNVNYAAAPQVAFTIAIGARSLTVTADTKSKLYGAADPPLTYQFTSGALVGSDAFTGALTRDPGESPGFYPIRQGTLTPGPSYALTYVGANLTIGKASQTITFGAIGDQTFGTAPFPVTATASSSLPVTFAATGSCTVSVTGTVTLSGTGTCTITASQSGNSVFNPAPDVARAFAIDLVDQYALVGNMVQPRSYHTATRLETGPLAGYVLIAGGHDASGAPTATSEVYNPATRTFAAAGNMPSKAAGHTATLIRCGTVASPCANDGKVLALGGGNSSAETYDPVARTWSPAGSLSSPRSFHTATVLGDGTKRVLIAGGSDNSGKALNSTILYNPSNGTFVAGVNLTTARERHTATLLPNGKVLIAGGRVKAGNGYTTLSSAEICDATACTSVTVSGLTARHSHAAHALPNGTVLLVGGANGATDLATAEVLTLNTGVAPAVGTVTPAGALKDGIGRRELTATGLPNGRAVVAGGQKGTTPKANSDLYKPPVAAGAPMNAARAGHAATPLTDAAGNLVNVLITGGVSGSPAKSVSSAELYGWFGP